MSVQAFKCNSIYLIFIPLTILGITYYTKNIRYTYDSYNFLCGAVSFSNHSDFRMCDGSFMVLSPPGFSFFVSFLLNQHTVGLLYKITSFIIFGFTLFCWFIIVKKEIKEANIIVFALLQFIFSIPLFYIHLFLWSEGLFVMIFSAGVLFLNYYKHQNKQFWLVLAVVMFSLSVTIRYAGFVLYVLVLASYFLAEKRFLRKNERLIIWLPIVIVGLLVLRNLSIDHSIAGYRPSSGRDLTEVLKTISHTLSSWIFPSGLIPASICAGICILLFILGFVQINLNTEWFLPFAGYMLFIVFLAYRTDVEFDERLFVPVFPFFIMTVFKSTPSFLKAKNIMLILIFTFWTVYCISRLSKNVIFWLAEP